MRRGIVTTAIVIAACCIPQPSADAHNYGDCAWSEQGETLVFPDGTYTCVCARQMGPQGKYDVWCSWRVVPKASARKSGWHLKKPALSVRKSIIHPLPKVVA